MGIEVSKTNIKLDVRNSNCQSIGERVMYAGWICQSIGERVMLQVLPRGGVGWALWLRLRLGSVAVAVAVAVAGAGAVAVAVAAAVIVAAARAVAVAQVGRLVLIMNNTGPCTTTS